MKRTGFTMVELIFVIIIIGILSVAAIPKFGDIKDRAKVSTEYSSLSGLDGSITAAMEFQYEDYTNYLVDWHEDGIISGADDATLKPLYLAINGKSSVLKKIVKKGDALKIVAFAGAGTAGTATNGAWDDILILKATASNYATGTKEADDAANGGNGKPDKNDFWVFNASPNAIDVYHHDGKTDVKTTVESGEITLIDNGAKVATQDAAAATPATPANSGKISIYPKGTTTTAITLTETVDKLLLNP